MSPNFSTRAGLWTLASFTLLNSLVNAQGPFGYGGGNNGNGPFSFGPGGNGDGGDGSSSSGSSSNSNTGYLESYPSINRALIAHAVIACLVWAFLIPVGGILLRLNIQSAWVVRVHALLQVLSYLLYIVAVGIGIWLIRSLDFGSASLWDDPHPKLGLAILALGFLQPIFGIIHHIIFKRRATNAKEGGVGKAPGRTAPGYVHLWLGRLLIVLGMINGGLGIRLAGRTPMQSSDTTRKAAIGYGVAAGVIFLIYVIFVVRFEVRKSKQNKVAGTPRDAPAPSAPLMHEVPPTYVESQESIQKDHTGATTYR